MLALAATAGGLGCKDNPGFALAPDGPVDTGDTVVGADTGEATTRGASTSIDPGTTDALTTTTGEPASTSTTGPPERFCGDGVPDADLDEDCDDGNKVPTDECTDGCRALFAEDGFNKSFGGTCIGLLAATFTHGDESVDLALVRNNQLFVAVLENDGDADFIDDNKIFTTEGNVVNVAIARQVDGDDADRKDIVALHNVISVCLNKTADGLCTNADEYELPPDFQDLEYYLPKFLQADDVDNNGLIDVVTFAKGDGDALTIFPSKPGGLLDPMNFKRLDFPQPLLNAAPTAMAVGPFTGMVEYPDLAVGYDDNSGGYVMYFPDFGIAGFAQDTDPILVGESVSSIAIADLGLPGDLGDLVVTDPVGGKLVFISEGPGAELVVQDEFIDLDAAEKKVVVAPFRGDGQPDIVTVDIGGANVHIASVVDGALPIESNHFETGLTGLVDVVVADLDADGDGDIAVVNTQCTVRVLINQTVVK